jgi:hypothetical protein
MGANGPWGSADTDRVPRARFTAVGTALAQGRWEHKGRLVRRLLDQDAASAGRCGAADPITGRTFAGVTLPVVDDGAAFGHSLCGTAVW